MASFTLRSATGRTTSHMVVPAIRYYLPWLPVSPTSHALPLTPHFYSLATVMAFFHFLKDLKLIQGLNMSVPPSRAALPLDLRMICSPSVASQVWAGGAQHTGNFENFKTTVKPTKSQSTFYLSPCTSDFKQC